VATPPRTAARRLDLTAIERSLRSLQRSAARGLTALQGRDPLDDRVIDNLLAGYARVDALVAVGTDVLALGHLRDLLELNNLVLCGTSAARRRAYARYLEATEHRFYDEREGGIQDLVEWSAMHQGEPAWDRAAGAYVRMLSRPQLFLEGNHRTGALLMSYVLLREGLPPFVLSPANATAYLERSARIRDIHKHSPAMRFRAAEIGHALAELLVAHAEPRYLLR
jgi:hypothetical protein